MMCFMDKVLDFILESPAALTNYVLTFYWGGIIQYSCGSKVFRLVEKI